MSRSTTQNDRKNGQRISATSNMDKASQTDVVSSFSSAANAVVLPVEESALREPPPPYTDADLRMSGAHLPVPAGVVVVNTALYVTKDRPTSRASSSKCLFTKVKETIRARSKRKIEPPASEEGIGRLLFGLVKNARDEVKKFSKDAKSISGKKDVAFKAAMEDEVRRRLAVFDEIAGMLGGKSAEGVEISKKLLKFYKDAAIWHQDYIDEAGDISLLPVGSSAISKTLQFHKKAVKGHTSTIERIEGQISAKCPDWVALIKKDAKPEENKANDSFGNTGKELADKQDDNKKELEDDEEVYDEDEEEKKAQQAEEQDRAEKIRFVTKLAKDRLKDNAYLKVPGKMSLNPEYLLPAVSLLAELVEPFLNTHENRYKLWGIQFITYATGFFVPGEADMKYFLRPFERAHLVFEAEIEEGGIKVRCIVIPPSVEEQRAERLRWLEEIFMFCPHYDLQRRPLEDLY